VKDQKDPPRTQGVAFEQLIADLSARVGPGSDALDETIVDRLRELCDALNESHVALQRARDEIKALRDRLGAEKGTMTLSALEVEHIRAVLESTNWRIRGSGGAAERLGLKPTTLESRMARLGITRRKVP